MKALTVGSLFAGIGGFDLGFERAGFEIRWQVEIDPFCRRVLEKHWPHVRRYEDVRRCRGMDDPSRWTQDCGPYDGPESDLWEDRGWATPDGVAELDRPDRLPYVDCICGGFPCQDISSAGAKAGIDGAQSGLWAEMFRIVRESRPRYVVVENVADLLARGLGRVLSDLASIGYDAEWDCIQAAAIGAPHGRDRLWLVAYPNTDEGRCEVCGQCHGSTSADPADGHSRRPDADRLWADVSDAAGAPEAARARRRTREGLDFEGWRADARQRAGWETEPAVYQDAETSGSAEGKRGRVEMRNMSFAMTTRQIRERSKTVTRRIGWKYAKVGDVVQPIVKGQGLKKGERVEKIGGPIRFVAVDRVVLGDISPQDVYREGFPDLTPRQFVELFKKANGGLKGQIVTRIQFEYVEAGQ